MRKNLLVQLTIAIFLPCLGGFLIAWIGFYQFEKTMESVAASYVQNLVQGAAARLETSYGDIYSDGSWRPNLFRSRIAGLNEVMLSGVQIPGVFAIFDEEGQQVYGPEDASHLSSVLRQTALAVEPQKMSGTDGRVYTVAVYPVTERELYVVAAVAWDELLGPMVSLATFWPFITGLLGLIGVFSVYIMWQKVIMPLKDLETEISAMKWGEDIPLQKAPEAVEELQKLREALVTLAQSAVAQAQLARRYVNDLVKVQEEERERISREIHDGPLQDVTAFVQRLRLISKSDDSPEERQRLLLDAENIALTGVREMRELCNDLTPPWLDLGIVQALTELSERQSRQLGVTITLDLDDFIELPEDATLAFFRVTQESVNNSVSHGEAKNVKVILREDEEANTIILEIQDDGKGFNVPDDITELRVQGHRGLSNMNERMSIVGGEVTIHSELGKGTTIRCELSKDKLD